MAPAGEISSLLTALFGAAAVSFGVSALVRRIGVQRGLVVAPRPDRWHRRPTPTYGGIGVLAGLLSGLAGRGGAVMADAADLLCGAAAVSCWWCGSATYPFPL